MSGMETRVINFYNEDLFDKPRDITNAYHEVIEEGKKQWVEDRAMEVAREIYKSVSDGAIIIPWVSSLIYRELTGEKGRKILVSSEEGKGEDYVQDVIESWYESGGTGFFMDGRAFLTIEEGGRWTGKITPLYIGGLPREVEELAERHGGPFSLVWEQGKSLREETLKSLKEVVKNITHEVEFRAWNYLMDREEKEGKEKGSSILFLRVSDKTLSPWEKEDWEMVAKGAVDTVRQMKIKRLGGACFRPGLKKSTTGRPKLLPNLVLSFRAEGLREKEAIVLVHPIAVKEFSKLIEEEPSVKIAFYEVFLVYEVVDWRALTDLVVSGVGHLPGSSIVAMSRADGHVKERVEWEMEKTKKNSESRRVLKIVVSGSQKMPLEHQINELLHRQATGALNSWGRKEIKYRVETDIRELREIEKILRKFAMRKKEVPEEKTFWETVLKKVLTDIESMQEMLDVLEGRRKLEGEEEIEELKRISEKLRPMSLHPARRLEYLARTEVCLDGKPIRLADSLGEEFRAALSTIEIRELTRATKLPSLEEVYKTILGLMNSSSEVEENPLSINASVMVKAGYELGLIKRASLFIDYKELRERKTQGGEWSVYTRFSLEDTMSVEK
jgi:hypothetical protein